MLTSYDTEVRVKQCSCKEIPFPHAELRVDYLMVHPILSRNAAMLVVRQDVMSMEPSEIDEVQAYLQQVSLPDTHILDVAAPHLDYVEVDDDDTDEDGDEEREQEEEHEHEAAFNVCPNCGRHGTLVNHEGEELSEPRSKEEALKDLEQFVTSGEIRMGDSNRIRIQILNSTLIDRPPQEDDFDDLL